MRLLRAIMPALALAAPAQAEGGAAAVTGCDISAYVTDPDPGGLNVRAAPSGRARVLKVVAGTGSAVAAVTGQSGAWLRVAGITDAETDARLFQGSGWIHVSRLGLDVASGDPRLYAGPGARSKMLARLEPDGSRVALLGCSGRWAKVRFGTRTGWLSPAGQCSNPLTTCS